MFEVILLLHVAMIVPVVTYPMIVETPNCFKIKFKIVDIKIIISNITYPLFKFTLLF